MKKASILFVALILFMITNPPIGSAQQELFDTKASTQHLDKGISYLNAKNFDAAIREFEASADINPDAVAYYYLGYAYYLKSRTSDGENRNKSRENFERAYEIDPNFSPSRIKPVTQPEQPAPPTSEATPTLPNPEPNQQQAEPSADKMN